METNRQHKISRLLQKELGDLFLAYAQNIKGTIISVTNVRISPDLSVSHIYLSVFPTDRTPLVFEKINEEKKDLRFKLGQRVRHQLRLIPELEFHIDDSLDYIENIDNLLKSDPPSPLKEDEKEEEQSDN